MDSREASGPPPPPPHQQQQQQPPPPSVLPGMMMGHHASFAAHNANSAPSNARFPFNSVVTSQPQPQPQPQSLSSAGTSRPMDSFNSPPFDGSPPLRSTGFNIEASTGKKKRGRPRKYAPDGNIALGLAPTPAPSVDHGDSGDMPSSETQVKKHRGRPPGSGKKQLDALGSAGVGFTPHVIMVKAGEDIASKIMAFSQQGPRTVCILSANGAICNVTLRQPAMTGGIISYEGRFEIISLSGSFSLSEGNSNSGRGRVGSLSVSLAGSDGRVVGGGVAGMLLAATPVQVIVGSFIADGKKSSSNLSKSGPSSAAAAPQLLSFGAQAAAVASSPSQGALSESSDDNGDSPPPNHGPGAYNNNGNQSIHGMPMYSSMGWPNSTMKMLPN